MKKFQKIFDDCKTEIGISDDLANKLKTGDFSDKSEKAKCFSSCIFKKNEFFDKDGKLVRDTIIKELLFKEPDPSKVDELTKVVDKCIGKVGANDCETSFNVYTCYFETRFGTFDNIGTVKACIAETKVPEEIALKLKDGDFSERPKEAKCLSSCIFKKKNYFKDGKLDRDAIIAGAMKKEGAEFKDLITKAVDKCYELTGADDCETSFKVYECYWNSRFGVEKTKEYFKECAKENNIDDDLAGKLKMGLFGDGNKNVQCFGACMFKKQGALGKDGKLSRDVLIGRLIQKEKAKPDIDAIIKSVDKCIGLGGATECEVAFNFYECYFKSRFGELPAIINPKIGEVLKTVVGA